MESVRYPQNRNTAAGCNRCPQSRPSGSGMPYRDRFQDEYENFPIGMSYVPWQKWGNLYSPEKGLCEGTIFADLNQIFCGKRGNRA